MSEKGQGGEALPAGTGTVLAEPGGESGATTTAQPKYEGRQPTDAEREAGRWLDDQTDAGASQPSGSGGMAARGADEGSAEWIDENTFMGPGGTPFEFQPTEGKGRDPTKPAPGQSTVQQAAESGGSQRAGSVSKKPPAERTYGRPSEGPTKVVPPDLDPQPPSSEGTGESSLKYFDNTGETPSPDDDHRNVLS